MTFLLCVFVYVQFNDMILLCAAKQTSKKFSVRNKIPLLSVKVLSSTLHKATALPV